MAILVSHITLTQQGIQEIKDVPSRIEETRKLWEESGGILVLKDEFNIFIVEDDKSILNMYYDIFHYMDLKIKPTYHDTPILLHIRNCILGFNSSLLPIACYLTQER